MNFVNTIKYEKESGNELMPEKPCGTGFHGGGGNL